MYREKPHGNAKKFSDSPRIEVARPKELPEGVPELAPREVPGDRDGKGRFLPGNGLAQYGGRLKSSFAAVARELGLAAEELTEFTPYWKHAEAWRRERCSSLAQTAGGGKCGSGPSALVAIAARQMAFAGYMLALALQHFAKGEIDAAQKLEAAGRASDNSSRQNNLAAFELCAREAKARPESAQAGGWLAGSITTEGQAVDDESPSGELVAPPDNTGHAFSSGGPAEIISEAQDDAPDAAPSTQNITPAEPSPFGGSARPGWLG